MTNFQTVAVLVPCYDEAATIERVVRDFSHHLPGCTVYVYDNNSTDGTAEVAAGAGAVTRISRRQGKGQVVRQMFADIQADFYLLVDGDATYDAASGAALVELVRREGLDMAVGARVPTEGHQAYRPGHKLGNRLFTGAVAMLFKPGFTDILSGYRCFSRRFVKSFPAATDGFEIETELTVHALSLKLPCDELPTPYAERPPGSQSKLSTFSDGRRILLAILLLMKEHRPMRFFGGLAVILAVLSLVAGLPVVVEFIQTGLVPRFPTAILAAAVMILAFMMFSAGLVLDSVARMRFEAKRLAYLAVPAALLVAPAPAAAEPLRETAACYVADPSGDRKRAHGTG